MKYELIDSHCHLDHEQFGQEQDQLIQHAREAGLSKLLTISTKLEAYQRLAQISEQYEEVFHTIGVHPHYASETGDVKAAYEILKQAAAHPKAIGVGETGLDYHYAYSAEKDQKAFFEMQMNLCLEMDLPMIVHTREADKDTALLLEAGAKRGNLKGILHCFSSSLELAMKGLELGFYISASGIITFKKSEDLREIFKQVPLDRLLIETDAPYLAPVPFRGKRNEPAYVLHVAEVLAEVKGVTLAEMAAQTSANFNRLFVK